MPLYFAYGLNMDLAGMGKRCPRSKPLGLARLPRHRFIVTSDGYASVIRDPREEVHGVLWDCALGDIRTLDKFEEHGERALHEDQPAGRGRGRRQAGAGLCRAQRARSAGPSPAISKAVIASARRSRALPEAYLDRR
jgi:hypothetical protein